MLLPLFLILNIMATKVGVKANGTLKKGFKYKKGGGVVKAKITTLKKKVAPKKKVAKKKTVNKGSLKASLLSAGVRLPHGYAIVKRAVKKRTVKMK